MVWSHNDQWMVTGDTSGYIKYWQSNMNNVKYFQAHQDPVRGLRYMNHHHKIRWKLLLLVFYHHRKCLDYFSCLGVGNYIIKDKVITLIINILRTIFIFLCYLAIFSFSKNVLRIMSCEIITKKKFFNLSEQFSLIFIIKTCAGIG